MNYPKISAIMPTTSARRSFVRRSLYYFNAQDYPNKELLVIDDGTIHESLAEDIPAQSNIHYVYVDLMGTDARLTIGAKRNLAASLATGDLLCHWDDDDYYGPRRLSEQSAPIRANEADVTAYQMSLLLDASDATLWRCSDAAHRNLFTHNVRSGTLMYRASAIRASCCYPNASRGEDVAFLRALLNEHHARLSRITDSDQYICVRHSKNVSDTLERTPPDWWQVPLEQHVPDETREFYEQLRQVA